MNKVCVVAVDIRSTHNVGSLLRTADGLSADVLLCGITPRPKNLSNEDRLPHVIEKTHSAISKTALGAESTVNTKYFKTIDEVMTHLKDNNYRIYALEQSKTSRSITELDANKDTALLIGPEVNGLSTDILEKCDEIFEIPMKGTKESFNVSVASGIALYQARLNDLIIW
jgi:tRNA G18 (ribose-2'-O)-methylase SpoU